MVRGRVHRDAIDRTQGGVRRQRPDAGGLVALQTSAGNRAVAGLVQRRADWNAAGVVTENIHVANKALTPDPLLGYTPPTLNGHQLHQTSDARGTLQPPDVDIAQREDGKSVASVRSVGNNTGSFVMELPQRGTWTAQTTLGRTYLLAWRYGQSHRVEEASGSGAAAELALRPRPDKGTFLANVRRHEQRHADDHRDAFAATVAAWDGRLTTAMRGAETFVGDSPELAENALYTAAGGKPDDVAAQFSDRCDAASFAFHRSDEGAGPDGLDARFEETGMLFWRNPHGRVAIAVQHP